MASKARYSTIAVQHEQLAELDELRAQTGLSSQWRLVEEMQKQFDPEKVEIDAEATS